MGLNVSPRFSSDDLSVLVDLVDEFVVDGRSVLHVSLRVSVSVRELGDGSPGIVDW